MDCPGTQEGILGLMSAEPRPVVLLRRELAHVSRAGVTTEGEAVYLVVSAHH